MLAPQYSREFKNQNQIVFSSFYSDVIYLLSKYTVGRGIIKWFSFLPYLICNFILFKDVLVLKPDVIIIFKGMEIYPSLLKAFKKMEIYLVNYNLDHPFHFVSKASGNKNVIQSIKIYDMHLTYSNTIKNDLKNKYPGIKVKYLPFGYHSYVDTLSLFHDTENYVCFIGQADSERADILKFLIKNGIHIHLYGQGWNRFLNGSKNVTIHPPIRGEAYWQTLHKYRVQLNLLRDHNINSHNMRTFEIPAASGIMLSKRTLEQTEFFKENEEAFYFDSENELLDKIHFIFSLTNSELQTIRKKARSRAFGHNYGHRALLMIDYIKKDYDSFHSHI